MSDQAIEFVAVGDTLADVALKETASASLAATTSILLAVLVIVSFVLNLLLIATVMSSYKLRTYVMYLMLCLAATLNIVDVIFITFMSLLYIANTTWIFGDSLCRMNAFFQQFILLKMLFVIMVMAMERVAILGSKLKANRGKCVIMFSSLLTFVALCFSIPVVFSGFPVQVYKYRYLCAIGSNSPLAYNVVEVIVYAGVLVFMLFCFGVILKKGNAPRSLPVKPQDYEAFIMETRAIQENLNLGKLVIFLTIAYLVLQGPYIILCFLVQIKNSDALLGKHPEYEVPQDADTLITWLRFFFPLIFPLIIFASCADIWHKLVNLTCCRRSAISTTGTCHDGTRRPKSSAPMIGNNVLTLVATSEGLQLRVPEGNHMYQRQMMMKQATTASEALQPPPEQSTMYGNVENISTRKHSAAVSDASESALSSATSRKKLVTKKPKTKNSKTQKNGNNGRWKY